MLSMATSDISSLVLAIPENSEKTSVEVSLIPYKSKNREIALKVLSYEFGLDVPA